MTRYAIYYTPPPGAFAQAAAEWLGRDAISGVILDPLHPDLPALSVNARRYGFHATLKPPFRLAEGASQDTLLATLKVVAADCQPVTLQGLVVASPGGFLALVPQGDVTGLNALAGQIVTRLDRLRAPLTDTEIARRNPATLSPRQRELLDSWGYPYVLDEFRFHMTLTDRLSDDQLQILRPLAEAHFAPFLRRSVVLDDLAVFAEDAEGLFHLRHRVPLG